MNKLAKSFIIVVSLLAVPGMSGWAADIEFTASPNGSWNVIGNWNEGSRVPTVGDTAIVNNGGTVLIDQNQSVDTLALGRSGTGYARLRNGRLSTTETLVGDTSRGTLTQTNGEHVVSGTLHIGEWTGAGNSAYTLQNGSINAHDIWLGRRASATFTQSGGIITVTNALSINVEGAGACSYILSTGELQTVKRIEVGGYGSAEASFTQQGGSVETGELRVGGQVAAATGIYTLSGTGSLSVTNKARIGYVTTGRLEQSGGTATFKDLYLGENSAEGTYVLSNGTVLVQGDVKMGNAGSSTGIFEVCGGELTIMGGIQPYSGATTFDFLGGILHSGFISLNTLTNEGGTLAPGASSIGQTTFYGNYIQETGGTLEIELNETSIDVIKNITAATLDGHLEVVLTDGFEPAPGWTSAPFLKTINGISGTFSSVSRLWTVVLSANGKEMSLKRLAPAGTVVTVK